MNRTDFQELPEIRIAEAAVLLAAQKWDGAYYLAGYAVECALKACIAKLTREFDFPDKRFAEQCFTHELPRLVDCADLADQLKVDLAADMDLKSNWNVVAKWAEISRYRRKTQAEAELLYNAITDATHGVLPWLKQNW